MSDDKIVEQLTQEDRWQVEINVRLFQFIRHFVNGSQINSNDMVVCGVQVCWTEANLSI